MSLKELAVMVVMVMLMVFGASVLSFELWGRTGFLLAAVASLVMSLSLADGYAKACEAYAHILPDGGR